ncbi:MAG: hypothetical protein H6729_00355 [Deltaproteobacteria bacterium]|nr:hypothetical protein [Deltaproteobacteria bacterium]
MITSAHPELQAGQTYRTRDFLRWGKNPARLARRLVREGRLREVTHGLYYAPVPSKFGPAPVADEVLLRAFLVGEPFIISGPPRWNALGLGATAMFASTLVYNTLRTGDFVLAGRIFVLRRVYFPEKPTPEWFVVDLLKHHTMAGIALSELRINLVATLRIGRWDLEQLRKMVATYGTKTIAALIEACIAEAHEAHEAHDA